MPSGERVSFLCVGIVSSRYFSLVVYNFFSTYQYVDGEYGFFLPFLFIAFLYLRFLRGLLLITSSLHFSLFFSFLFFTFHVVCFTRGDDPKEIARILQNMSGPLNILPHPFLGPPVTYSLLGPPYTHPYLGPTVITRPRPAVSRCCKTSWCTRTTTPRSEFCKNCQNARNVKRSKLKKKAAAKSGAPHTPQPRPRQLLTPRPPTPSKTTAPHTNPSQPL